MLSKRRGLSSSELNVLFLWMFALCAAQPALAQATPWSAGIDAMVANPSRLTSPFLLGVSVSRMVVSGSVAGLRVDVAAAHALTQTDLVCTVGPGPCDTRQTSAIGMLLASLTVGRGAVNRLEGGVYGLISAGAYGTQWRYSGSGSAPSGLAAGVGAGLLIPDTSLRLESRYLRLGEDGSYSVTVGLKLAW